MLWLSDKPRPQILSETQSYVFDGKIKKGESETKEEAELLARGRAVVNALAYAGAHQYDDRQRLGALLGFRVATGREARNYSPAPPLSK